jgi:hypothetical protein
MNSRWCERAFLEFKHSRVWLVDWFPNWVKLPARFGGLSARKEKAKP